MQDRRGRSVTGCLHQIPYKALVAQRTERRASTSGPCGFESCRGPQTGRRTTENGRRMRKTSVVCHPSSVLRYVHVAQWTRAEASDASGCAFESRRGLQHRRRRTDDGGQKEGRLIRRLSSVVRRLLRRVGRAARHRGANAARPSGRAGSTPAPSAMRA